MQKIKAEIIRPALYSYGNRVETGAVEFEYPEGTEDPKDWPGVFIRGDNALMLYAPALEHILKKADLDGSVLDTMHMNTCMGLIDLLKECQVKPKTGE